MSPSRKKSPIFAFFRRLFSLMATVRRRRSALVAQAEGEGRSVGPRGSELSFDVSLPLDGAWRRRALASPRRYGPVHIWWGGGEEGLGGLGDVPARHFLPI